MPVPTLTIADKPEDVLEENVHTRTTLQADPLAASLSPPFDGLITEYKQVTSARIDLVVTLFQCTATAFQVDTQLNGVVDDLVRLLTQHVGPDRTAAEWVVFFQNVEPYSFKRPILGAQLDKMKTWPSALAMSTHAEIQALGAKLTPLLAAGDSAAAAIQAAEQARINFDNMGSWRQHIDKSNAARATAYGALLQIPHQNPTAKLPSDYAELFFLHDTSRRGAGKPRSSADIQAELASLQTKTARSGLQRRGVARTSRRRGTSGAPRQGAGAPLCEAAGKRGEAEEEGAGEAARQKEEVSRSLHLFAS